VHAGPGEVPPGTIQPIYQRALHAIRVPLDSVGTAIDAMASAQRMCNPATSSTTNGNGTGNVRTCSCGCGYSPVFCPSLMIDPRLSELHKVRFEQQQHQQQQEEEGKEDETGKETTGTAHDRHDHDGDVEMMMVEGDDAASSPRSSPSPPASSSTSSSSWTERYCKPLPFPVQFFFPGNEHDGQDGQCTTPSSSPSPSMSTRRLESYRQLKNRAATLSLFVVFNIANVLHKMSLVAGEAEEEEEEDTDDSPENPSSGLPNNGDLPNFVMLYQYAYKMSCLQDTDADFDVTTWMTSPMQVRSFVTCQKRIMLTILNNLGRYIKRTTTAPQEAAAAEVAAAAATANHAAFDRDTTAYNYGNEQQDEVRSRQFFEHMYVELLQIHQEPVGTTTVSNGNGNGNRNGGGGEDRRPCRSDGRGPTLRDFTIHEPDFDLQGLVDRTVVELRMLSPSTTAPAPAA